MGRRAICVLCKDRHRYVRKCDGEVPDGTKGGPIGIPANWIVVEVDRFGNDKDACICPDCQNKLLDKIIDSKDVIFKETS